jgi:hypothetical protein
MLRMQYLGENEASTGLPGFQFTAPLPPAGVPLVRGSAAKVIYAANINDE